MFHGTHTRQTCAYVLTYIRARAPRGRDAWDFLININSDSLYGFEGPLDKKFSMYTHAAWSTCTSMYPRAYSNRLYSVEADMCYQHHQYIHMYAHTHQVTLDTKLVYMVPYANVYKVPYIIRILVCMGACHAALLGASHSKAMALYKGIGVYIYTCTYGGGAPALVLPKVPFQKRINNPLPVLKYWAPPPHARCTCKTNM